MGNIVFRKGQLQDLPDLTSIYNHYVRNTATTFDLLPYQPRDRMGWFEQFRGDKHQLLVACDDQEVLGYASSSQFRAKAAYDQTVETTIYLRSDQTGKGLGGRLYRELLNNLDTAGVHTEIAVVTQPNDASVALHKKLGFEAKGVLDQVGYKFEQYWSTLWLQRQNPKDHALPGHSGRSPPW